MAQGRPRPPSTDNIVNHDKLMDLVAKEVKDKRVLELMRAYLNSDVMINGVKEETEKGCPQGGPLSPLLSNIMLKELDKRNHKFCRYADDNQLYVKSKKAAKRAMESITNFIEGKLKLKINKEKSAINRPWKRKFLGYSFYIKKKEIGIRIHPKSIKKVKAKVKAKTSRSNAWSMECRILKLRQVIAGW